MLDNPSKRLATEPLPIKPIPRLKHDTQPLDHHLLVGLDPFQKALVQHIEDSKTFRHDMSTVTNAQSEKMELVEGKQNYTNGKVMEHDRQIDEIVRARETKRLLAKYNEEKFAWVWDGFKYAGTALVTSLVLGIVYFAAKWLYVVLNHAPGVTP
jgi:hypothetical protein